MRMRGLKLGISKEEKVALSIGKLLSDFSLDLEAVGKYMAVSNPYVIYVRALEVLESTEYNKTVQEYREIGKYYGNNL
jgi:homoserine acetyltransferase